LCWWSPVFVGMRIWAWSFDKNCISKCHWHTLCDTSASSGCENLTLKLDTNHVSCHSSSKFCKIQCFKLKNFHQAMLWNAYCINRTATSYRGQMVIQGQSFKMYVWLAWRTENFSTKKGKLDLRICSAKMRNWIKSHTW
jgi:hypothetical protein